MHSARLPGALVGLAGKFFRRKAIDTSPTTLARKLGVFDLMGLGVGATLGAGVYVLTGVVAKTEAGPAIVLSFFISGCASILSGLCYAEFGARVPQAGSAYVYCYVTVGEMLAWTTGWQLLLEYVIGASSVARSWSGYVDNLAGGAVSSAISNTIGTMNVPGLATDPDILGAAMTMLLSCIVAVGVKESTMVNNVLTTINVIVIIFVIIAGAIYAEPKNFTPFAPNGFAGVFKGAATSFYAYVGFDVIATSAEETINPAKVIPISIIGSLLLCAACYMGVSGVVTLMVPYSQLDDTAPLAAAFDVHGAKWAKYIISIGAICGLSTSLMTCIFPMPRIIYAIASDGLLPPWIGKVHPRFNTPVVATLVCGAFAASMALIFDIEALADMMSIGTLISYTLVAASVLVLRYREFEEGEDEAAANGGAAVELPTAATSSGTAQPLLAGELCVEHTAAGYTFLGMRPFRAASWALLTYTAALAVASSMSVILTTMDGLSSTVFAVVVGFAALGLAVAAAALAVLLFLPRGTPKDLAFHCPGMPGVPLFSIAINVYLLVSLSPLTWVRFAVWCVIGAGIYMGYGITHSKVGIKAAAQAEEAAEAALDKAANVSGGSGAPPSRRSLHINNGSTVTKGTDAAVEEEDDVGQEAERTPLTASTKGVKAVRKGGR